MLHGTGETLRRPDAMALDVERCIECGTCEALVPGILSASERIAITQASLEAMAQCPVGALRWLEGPSRDRKEIHDHDDPDDA